MEAAGSPQACEWWRGWSEEWGTLFLRRWQGRARGHQSCFWALGAQRRLVWFSVSGHLPGGCPWPVSIPAMAASPPSPGFASSSLPGGRSQGTDFPCDKVSLAHTAALCKGTLPGPARIVSKSPEEAASVPLPALHPELSGNFTDVPGSLGPATCTQNSWGEAGEGARLVSDPSSSLPCSRFLLLLL